MSSQGNRTIISHVWLNIVRFLKPEDALNVSMVCRSWYMQFTDQALWEVVCKSILAGYNTEHFMVPYIIETIKRPSPLDGSRVRVLENWTHSWKQRTVYLKHIMYIQSSAVATLRTRTDIFMEVPTDPWCNMEKVNVLERYMAAPLPIDFVIFMAYYAQQLRIVPDPHGLQFTTLASGGLFDDEELWLDFVEEEFNFAVFDQGGFTTGGTEFGNIKDFFCQMTAIPFAQPAKYDFDRFSLNVYLMLSKNLDHYPDILRQNSNAAYIEDLRSMINGAGKVFFAHREFENWCDFRYVAESFTDYMIQYTGVVLEYGMIPPLYQFGSYDMLIPLPRDQSPRQSILLPQPKEWDIGNYLPTYFLCEDNNRNLRSTVPSVWTANPENAAELMVQQIDNPDNILLQNPPECMFRGYSMAKWKPYQDFLSSREKRIKKNTLDDFGRGRLPTQREVHIDMNNDIYDILKSMVDNWKATCPSSVGSSRNFDPDEIDHIKEKTSKITHVFEVLTELLPIALYYLNREKGEQYLWTTKLFEDHLVRMREGNPKYSLDELSTVIARRFSHCLRLLTEVFEGDWDSDFLSVINVDRLTALVTPTVD